MPFVDVADPAECVLPKKFDNVFEILWECEDAWARLVIQVEHRVLRECRQATHHHWFETKYVLENMKLVHHCDGSRFYVGL